ncbi:Arc family DNA-binding protein [Arsenicitalea aurantiaca]|uniref:Arc family DNA-binding protein n=1 Tax=Arsenicitalea aurantiaca TaxID=1783274 RepID=A0A433XEU7_9HYPH|nr:Arc family DNA-binding protein [Arsenicitalea aurantiaca]
MMLSTGSDKLADDGRKLTTNITPFGLRMQPELKATVENAARGNNRSMNSEIVARLEFSLSAEEEIERLRGELAAAKAEIRNLEGRLEYAWGVEIDREKLRADRASIERMKADLLESARRSAGAPGSRPNVLYVALDANGMPLSWQEIMLHMAELGRAAGFEIQNIEARVFDAQPASNDAREEEWWSLVETYRARRAEGLPITPPQVEAHVDAPLEADVRAVIHRMQAEKRGIVGEPGVDLKTQLGRDLSDAVDDRTEFAMKFLLDELRRRDWIRTEKVAVPADLPINSIRMAS